jgi:uncharacterized protein YdhG (YjbR/CyaY superfamily)
MAGCTGQRAARGASRAATSHNGTVSTVDQAAQAYIDGIAPQNRPLFDRLHGLILGAYPDAAVGLSYRMPAYTVGGRRLYVAAWKHGLSIYGWPQGREAGFAARHPGLKTSKGTIQLSPGDSAGVGDGELLELIRAALES